MSSNDNSLEPIRRFRLMAVRGTVLLTALVAVAAYFYDPLAAQGVLLGGIAGVLGFWIMAVRLEKIVLQKPEKVQVAALTLSTLRFAMYGVVLYKAFSLDRENYVGLIGGVIGIMLIRLVLVVVAVLGLDQRGHTTENNAPDDPGE